MDYTKTLNIQQSLVFPNEDWENIPQIVPNTMNLLQSEIFNIIQLLKNVFHTDKIIDSKVDFVEEVDVIKMKLAKNAAEVAKAVGEVRSLGNVQEELWNDIAKLKNESEKNMDFVKRTKQNILGKNEEKNEIQFQNLTMWNINGLKKLITDTLNESETRRLIEVREFDLMHIDEQIDQIVKFNEKMILNVENEISNLHEKMSDNEKIREQYNNTLKDETKKVKEKIFDMMGETESIRKTARELNEEFKKTIQNILKISDEMQEKVNETNSRIDKTRLRIKKRKNECVESQKACADSANMVENMKQRIDKQDAVIEVFKDIVEEQKKMKILESSMNATKIELKKLVSETLENIKTDTKEIKVEVFKKLSENDKEMRNLLSKMDIVTNSLEDWALKVIKPAQSNEAKIFTLEARIKEEETQRMLEANKNIDHLKKMIYALEQYSLGRIDKDVNESQIIKKNTKIDTYSDKALSEDDMDENCVLPPVEGATKQSKPIFETSVIIEQPKSILHNMKNLSTPEMMLLKRLHCVKKLMDGIGNASQTAINFAKALQLPETETKTKKIHRAKRRIRLHKEVPDLFIEAKKAVQEMRKKGLSKEREDSGNATKLTGSFHVNQALAITQGFDYKTEKQKHGQFKNYVATIQGEQKEDYVFFIIELL